MNKILVIATSLLIILIAYYEVATGKPLAALIKSSFLVLFLPAIWQQNLRRIAFFCFVLLVYFMSACLQIFNPGWLIIDIIILTLIIIIFILSIWLIRTVSKDKS